MTILIVHGILGHAGIHWQQWLHDQLAAQGHVVIMPNLSEAKHPDRQAWLSEVKKLLQNVAPEDLLIVGHSLGVTCALDYLEQCSGNVKGLVSVSGIAKDYGAELNGYYLREKDIDFDKVREHVASAVVVYGDNDPYVKREALRDVAEGLAVEPVIIKNGGHLNTEAGYTTFPRLLEIVRSLL